ncbi:hypothetical protein PIROE2DRAFT_14975 [Piromyces sp. E2]|nr:hypothetical protein PIROE2DRAFT_14975 [Piromyces sp. E2]|eukprot:OUM59495.1 hypothetical protein PIROE2DRAFT_14975 [Piromyces sp. E2]
MPILINNCKINIECVNSTLGLNINKAGEFKNKNFYKYLCTNKEIIKKLNLEKICFNEGMQSEWKLHESYEHICKYYEINKDKRNKCISFTHDNNSSNPNMINNNTQRKKFVKGYPYDGYHYSKVSKDLNEKEYISKKSNPNNFNTPVDINIENNKNNGGTYIPEKLNINTSDMGKKIYNNGVNINDEMNKSTDNDLNKGNVNNVNETFDKSDGNNYNNLQNIYDYMTTFENIKKENDNDHNKNNTKTDNFNSSEIKNSSNLDNNGQKDSINKATSEEKNENYIIYFGIGSVVLIIAICAIFFIVKRKINNKRKRKIKEDSCSYINILVDTLDVEKFKDKSLFEPLKI